MSYLEGPQLKLGGHIVQPADHEHITLQHHVTSGLLDCLLEHSTVSRPPGRSCFVTITTGKKFHMHRPLGAVLFLYCEFSQLCAQTALDLKAALDHSPSALWPTAGGPPHAEV